MQGLIFQQLKEFIRKKMGFNFWDEIRKQAGVETTLFAPVQAYPDTELLSLIRTIADRLGLPVQSMLEEFGRFFAVQFVESRAYLFDPKWDYFDFVEHAPEIFRQVEKRHLPDSDPAFVQCTRDGPEQVTMRYSSKRKLCAFVKGILQGMALHYNTEADIQEPRCVFKGQAECTLIVRRRIEISEETSPADTLTS